MIQLIISIIHLITIIYVVVRYILMTLREV